MATRLKKCAFKEQFRLAFCICDRPVYDVGHRLSTNLKMVELLQPGESAK